MLLAGGCAGSRYPFLTSKERANETGLDYFLARYYSSIAGRFTGSAPGPFTPADPQSLNRYPYTQNNPLKFIDPTGRSLYLSGADADYIVAELAKFSGLSLERDSKTGKVTIKKSSKRKLKGTSTWLANKLIDAIRDPRAEVKIQTGRNQPNVFFDSYASQQLDVADYNAVKAADPKFAAVSLGHVIEEYYYEQLIPLTELDDSSERPAGGSRGPLTHMGRFPESHTAALGFESKVMSDFTGWWEQPMQQKSLVSTPSLQIIRFEYSTISYDVTIKNSTVVRITTHEKTKPR